MTDCKQEVPPDRLSPCLSASSPASCVHTPPPHPPGHAFSPCPGHDSFLCKSKTQTDKLTGPSVPSLALDLRLEVFLVYLDRLRLTLLSWLLSLSQSLSRSLSFVLRSRSRSLSLSRSRSLSRSLSPFSRSFSRSFSLSRSRRSLSRSRSFSRSLLSRSNSRRSFSLLSFSSSSFYRGKHREDQRRLQAGRAHSSVAQCVWLTAL